MHELCEADGILARYLETWRAALEQSLTRAQNEHESVV